MKPTMIAWGIIMIVVAASVPSCLKTDAEHSIRVIVTGPLVGEVIDAEGNLIRSVTTDEPLPIHEFLNGFREATIDYRSDAGLFQVRDGLVQSFWLQSIDADPYALHFTVVDQGPTTIQIVTDELPPRNSGGPFAEGEKTVALSLFVITAPVGAELRMIFTANQDADEMLLAIDEDGDGAVDREQRAVAVQHGGDVGVNAEYDMTEAQVEELGEGRAQIALELKPPSREDSLLTTYYSVYPAHPQPQPYTEPFVVDEGSFILYGSHANWGGREVPQELTVLGGIAPDVDATIEVDGPPVTIDLPVPGQRAFVSFEGRAGQEVTVIASEVSIGYLACCGVWFSIESPNGKLLSFPPATVAVSVPIGFAGRELPTAILPEDGRYVIQIDPIAANAGASRSRFDRIRGEFE